MTNLKEEIEKILKETSCKDMYSGLGAESFLSLFRQTMMEVIGEDEDYYGELSMWDKAQNSLRAEMRERVEKILDQDS